MAGLFVLFGRKAKRLKRREKDVLDSQIKRILANPGIGEEKRGDLRGVRVHKFKMQKQLILLAYSVSKQELNLIIPCSLLQGSKKTPSRTTPGPEG